MWAVAELSLRKMRESSLGILILIGAFLCVLADSAAPIADQLDKNSLFNYALGSQSMAIPPISAGTASAMLFSVLLCVFWGASEIPGDMSTGLIQVVLAKPVGRLKYLLGKYLAMLTASFAVFTLFEIILLLSQLIFKTGSVHYTLAAAGRQFLVPLMLAPLTAIAMLFSLFAGGMGGMIFTVIYLLFSAVISFLPVTLALFPKGTLPGLGEVVGAVHYFFPNLLYYIQDSIGNTFMVCVIFLYTVSVTLLFLLFMLLRIQKMDLNRQ